MEEIPSTDAWEGVLYFIWVAHLTRFDMGMSPYLY